VLGVMRRGPFWIALSVFMLSRSGAGQALPVGATTQHLLPGAPRVVVEYDAQQTSSLLAEGVTRVVAELRVAGFEVQMAGERGADAAVPNEGSASALPPLTPYATMSLSERDDQLTVEIRSDSNANSSRLIILGRERDVAVLALKSAEFLRAGLAPHVQAARSPVTSSGMSHAPAPAAIPQRLPAHLWQLDLGGAFLTNLGVGDHLPLLTIHPAYLALPRLALGAALDLPLGDAHFEASQGSGSYRVWFGSVSASASWLKWRNGEMTVGASAGVARTLSTAVPNPPLKARQPAFWSLALSLDAGLDYQVIEPLALVAEAHLLALSPSPVVAVVEDERRLGRPSLMLGLSARIFYE
jgi:hypothetical protein